MSTPATVQRTQRPGRQLRVVPAPPGLRYDVTRVPLLRTLLSKRWFQFVLVLPNQLMFWLVIVAGLVGRQVAPGNIATAITWYLWFCVVFVLMVGVGRGWCAMCPFGGGGEWLQRKAFFKRKQRGLGLGIQYPERLAKYGLLPAVGIFVGMTFFEEFFNVAGPDKPYKTSILVAFVLLLAFTSLFVFERRSFCRYLCPLSPLIGTVGQMGMVAGFRARNRDVCLSCETKECMRGSANGYGCPWYEYPGQASTNSMCGLCTECFKNCPNDNVGLFVQPPLTSLYSGVRRRMDLAVGFMMLAGLMWYQQINALGWYGTIEDKLNSWIHWPHYPNPVLFLAAVLLPVPLLYGVARGAAWARRGAHGIGWRRLFVDSSYALIPLVGMDYLARQLPKFFNHVPRLLAVISNPFGLHWNLFGTAHLRVADHAIFGTGGIVWAQVIVVLLGLAATLYAAVQIRRHTAVYREQPGGSRALQVAVMGAVVALVAGAQIWMYVLMKAAE